MLETKANTGATREQKEHDMSSNYPNLAQVTNLLGDAEARFGRATTGSLEVTGEDLDLLVIVQAEGDQPAVLIPVVRDAAGAWALDYEAAYHRPEDEDLDAVRYPNDLRIADGQ